MLAKTENLPFIGLFISIFIAIVMGFVIGSSVENLVFEDLNSHLKDLVEEELESVRIMNKGMFVDTYAKLNSKDHLITGLNIIDFDGTILYSDEPSLVGKKFSDESKIPKVFKSKEYFVIDRNLISQETILKESNRHLLVLFYYFEDSDFIIQVLYDIRTAEKEVLQITALLWFTILLSIGMLFIVLLSISNITKRTLEKAKRSLEIEVYKRTKDLQELSADLDRQVKERTKDLESANKELIQKTTALNKTKEKLEYKNYELESAIKSINKQHKELIRKTIELTELQNKLEDKNYDLLEIKKELEKKNIELQSAINEANKQNSGLIRETIELTELKNQLEDKNYELQEANEEVLKLVAARTEFIKKAAHDLRTPITPILLLIPPIKKHIKDKEVLYDFSVIERNANYLRHIADNLISYLKSRTGQYKYTFIKKDIRKVIGEVLVTFKESFNQHKISIIKKIPSNLPLVEIEEVRITEVIQNIISNALNFMPRGGKMIISAKKMDNFINIRFKDTGIGMTKITLSKIFDEFYRADESRHIAGHGLGLSICREIIVSHHGKMWAESKGLRKGSTILFDIPIKQK